jgi:PTH1 family peptidyl-tRNA hydrolase
LTKLVVGLGNTGAKYARTRHNLGFAVIAELGERYRLNGRPRGPAIVAEGTIAGEEVVLGQPTTMMNLSGKAVAALSRSANVHDFANLLIIYDDMDIALGLIRLRARGSAGGHNGIKSIVDHLHSQEFPRLRIGLGRPPEGVEPIEFVLQTFRPEEKPLVDEAVKTAADVVEFWIANGIEPTMDKFNGWRPPLAQ